MIRHPSSIHATLHSIARDRYANLAEELRSSSARGSAALVAGDRFSIYQQGIRWKIIDRSSGAIVAEASTQTAAVAQLGAMLDREGSTA